MTISIITACYNSASVIRTAMESVLRQTWPEIEYLVIDGGSTDGTVDTIREYEPNFGGRMRWLSEKDRGMYDAINKGIRMATGDVVGILNADDVLSDDRVIERVAEAFGGNSLVHDCESALDENDSLSATQSATVSDKTSVRMNLRTNEPLQAVYGDIRFVANLRSFDLEALRREKTIRYYSSRYFHSGWARFGYMPAHPTFYCRRDCFEKHGCYKTDYKIAADHELLIRFLVKEKIRCRYLPEVMVVMRLGGMSTRSVESTLVLNRENIRACRSNGVYTNRVMQLGKYLIKIPGLLFKNGY